MSFLPAFTLGTILYQTVIATIISWSTLGCKLSPQSTELHEVTLMKLLYLYDPVACGRIHLYNYTIKYNSASMTTVVWPMKNVHATAFRGKIQLWLSLHVLWLLFYFAYKLQGRRPCGFYTALIAFTLTGVSLLVVSIVYTGLFLADLRMTGTEDDIIHYINEDNKSMKWINKTSRVLFVNTPDPDALEDTSWIALLFAYFSCGAIVQWVINFWVVKDNYFCGMEMFRRFQSERTQKLQKEEDSILSV